MLIATTDRNGNTVSIARDSFQHTTSPGSRVDAGAVALAYAAANRRTTLTLPNGIMVAYRYDGDSRLSGMTWKLSGSQIGDLEYAYDTDGHVVGKTGSMAAVNLPAAVSGNSFNADNEMTSFNGAALAHDANGNLTSQGATSFGRAGGRPAGIKTRANKSGQSSPLARQD